MRKLSVRKRGQGAYEVGEAGIGPVVTVTARGKREALKEARPLVREKLRREPEGKASRRVDAKKDARLIHQVEGPKYAGRKGGRKPPLQRPGKRRTS